MAFVDRKPEILRLLKVEGRASLAHVAGGLGVTKQAALRHLDALQAQGIIERAPSPANGRGRPEHVYRLTAAALDRFPQAHRELAADLVRFLPEEQLETFFSQRAARLEAEYSARLAGLDFGERVRELARLASEHGHMAEVVSQPDGGLGIRHCHCPIADVAGETGHPCRQEQEMYGRLLGREVVRTTYIPDAEPACTFVVTGSAEALSKG